MTSRRRITVDGNEAAASVAYRASEVIAIYPITPSSPMAELCDEWASRKKPNLWGAVPEVAEMQSEGGAAGAVHGALQAGALATTFTASQGLLLMIPNMYKIAGELTPFTMHVAARTLATHALVDLRRPLRRHGLPPDRLRPAVLELGAGGARHGRRRARRDARDAHPLPALLRRLPHLARGREDRGAQRRRPARADSPRSSIYAHRQRGLTPDRPVLRGTAQNPDVFFQAREAANGFYDACPAIVERTMQTFAELTGRRYESVRLRRAIPTPSASSCSWARAPRRRTRPSKYLVARGEKVGVLKVRLYRPFARSAFLAALPTTRPQPRGARSDEGARRHRRPALPRRDDGARRGAGRGLSPFAVPPRVIAGRYGLSSKEFTPAMVKAVFDEIAKRHARSATSPSASSTT